MNGQTAQAVDIIAEQAARIAELERQLSESRATVAAAPRQTIPDAELLSIAATRNVAYVFNEPSMAAVLAYGREVAKRATALAAQQAQAAPVAAQCKRPGDTWEECGIDEEEVMEAHGYEFRYLYATPAQPQVQPQVQPQPIAWARRWYIDGEKPHKVKNANGRLHWGKFKLQPMTPLQARPDDVPLYAGMPQVQPAGDAKDAARYRWLRERTVAWNALLRPDWKSGAKLDAAIDAAMQSAAGGAQ